MNHPNFILPNITDILFTVLFIILSKLAFSAAIDPHYVTCNNQSSCANGPNISYPFYIQEQQDFYCGYPRFKLSCNKNGHPVLKLQTNYDFVIRKIFYNNQSLLLSYDTSTTSNNCIDIHQIQNLSLSDNRFEIASKQSQVFLFRNCKNSSQENVLQQYYKVDGGGREICNNSGGNQNDLAIFKDDPNLGNVSRECGGEGVEVNVYGEDEIKRRKVEIGEIIKKGFMLKWIAANCSICEQSGGKCGFNQTTYQFKCFCTDRPHSSRCRDDPAAPGHGTQHLKLGIGIGVGLTGVVLSIFMVWHWRRRKNASDQDHRSRPNSSYSSSKSDMEKGNVYFGVPIFSYKELEKATSNFSDEKELGDGGFGTVYYGKLRDGREVAVKRLYEHNYKRVEQFMNEIKILTRLRHKNLVSLYGCTSRHSQGLLLVYEFVANGTVADHLHGDKSNPKNPLSWALRMKIAIETAAALAYLHASDIIHRDVKTNNILLDNNFSVKVADFGLSRLLPTDVTHVSTAPQGSPGYVDPEYHQCFQLTDKSDVYSFGVVLMELISSMPAVDISRHKDEIVLANLAINRIQRSEIDGLIDPSLGFRSDKRMKRMIVSVAELAFQCLQQNKDMRPSMEEVQAELIRIDKIGEEYELDNADNEAVKSTMLPPPSPPLDCSDEVALLKNRRFSPSSPVSVTEKWISSSNPTPNISC